MKIGSFSSARRGFFTPERKQINPPRHTEGHKDNETVAPVLPSGDFLLPVFCEFPQAVPIKAGQTQAYED